MSVASARPRAGSFSGLQSEFAEHVTLDPYFWEWEPWTSARTISRRSRPPPTSTSSSASSGRSSAPDSVINTSSRPTAQETASSGTQYELLQALHGKQQHPEKLPDLLVWVNKAPPPAASSPPLSAEGEDELIRQRRALQDFLAATHTRHQAPASSPRSESLRSPRRRPRLLRPTSTSSRT